MFSGLHQLNVIVVAKNFMIIVEYNFSVHYKCFKYELDDNKSNKTNRNESIKKGKKKQPEKFMALKC